MRRAARRGCLAAWATALVLTAGPVAGGQTGDAERAAGSGAAAVAAPAPDITTGHVRVERIVFEGNTVFTSEQLHGPVQVFEGRLLAAEDVEDIRRIVTQYYVDRGYVNSGALVKHSAPTNGVLELQVIEGVLREVEVGTDGRLARAYIRARLPRPARDSGSRPLNTYEIQRCLKLLKDDPRVENVTASLGPGVRLGEAVLDVRVTESKPWQVALTADNHGSASLGSVRYGGEAGWLNLSGWGDAVHGEYSRVGESSDSAWSYAVPLAGDDTTLSVESRSASAAVTSEPFDELDIESSLDAVLVSLKRPMWRTPSKEFALELKLEKRHSRSSLLGEPYSFSPGVENGESRDTAVRFCQRWVSRNVESVFAFHSAVNWGIDAWDATVHDDLPDGLFVSWTGQAQWLRRLETWDSQLVLKSNAQFSPDPLLQIEKVSVGGSGTVRGYRENQITSDNAWVGTVEWRIPLLEGSVGFGAGRRSRTALRVMPFLDAGRGWNKDGADPDPNFLWSAGLGLDYSIGDGLRVAGYWGHGFVKVEEAAIHDLQDDGVHFEARVGY